MCQPLNLRGKAQPQGTAEQKAADAERQRQAWSQGQNAVVFQILKRFERFRRQAERH